MSKPYYFINKFNKRVRAENKEKLSGKIEPNTLVWTEGMDEWEKAKDIDELNEIPNSHRTQIFRKTMQRHQLRIHPGRLSDHTQIQHRKTLPIRTQNLLF